MGTKSEQARELFLQGYNCAQAVFAAYAGDYGIPQEQAFRLAASFGGGMGRMREVCGALTGAFLVAGLATGATEGSDTAGKKRNYDLVQRMAAAFRETEGSIYCRELLGLRKEHHTDTNPEARTPDYYAKRPCLHMVERACEILDAELEKLNGSGTGVRRRRGQNEDRHHYRAAVRQRR